MLRSALREFYPAALAAFDDLTSGDAVEVLRAAPAPALGAALSRPKIAAALRRGGRQRRIDARAAQIQAALRTPQLAPAPVIAAAMGATVSASVAVIAEMTTQITALERQLAADFEAAPGRGGGPFPARTRDHPRRPGARRVRRRAGPLCHRQVSQELRRNITDHQSLRHQARRAGPPRPQPAPRRRASTSGPSPPSAPHPAPAPSTTTAAPPATPTTPRSAPSATASSASCTAAWPTTPPTAKPPPGPTAPAPASPRPLDTYSRGMSSPA